VHLQGAERLEVGLNSGTTAGITASDAERDRGEHQLAGEHGIQV
jgi:hypothetical protein